MGLDMYLMGDLYAPSDSIIGLTLGAHLTAADRSDMQGDVAYISSWQHDKNPHPAYMPLVEITGITPPKDSPVFFVKHGAQGGYILRPRLACWWKVTHVHRFFVEHCPTSDGYNFPVHPEQLADLYERCEKVLVNHRRARSLLPHDEHFGTEGYGEWYYWTLLDTVRQLDALKPVLMRTPGLTLTYEASW